ASTLININTASAVDLETLPGIGPKTAEAIIAYRDANGPFATIEAITEVKGIGPATLEKLR
ncbi:MAG: helix-hairpin-helix domain-containing protein, partial [Anaerolineae bacterium]|nr:helix-hairpin-helix domain-containing protein [Anaerolineae bacterium]